MAERQYTLVYGGGSSGIMGVVSNAVLENGGDVIGVIPFAMQIGGGEGNKVQEIAKDTTLLGKVCMLPMMLPWTHLTSPRYQRQTVSAVFQ